MEPGTEPQVGRPDPPPAARRRWPRRLATASVVVLAALIALVALAPSLLSGLGADLVERAFARSFQGRLELDGLDLGWTGRQRVGGARLSDPAGAEVARLSVELPGLLALARGRGARLGRIRATARAHLVAGDDGATNLDRALAPRPRARAPRARESPSGEGLRALESLDLELDLALEQLRWEDATTRAAGAPFELSDAVVHVLVAPGGSISARAEGAMSGAAGGTLRLAAQLERAFAPASSDQPPRLEADVHVAGLPVALLDNLARQGGLLVGLLGPSLTVDVRASGTAQEGRMELELSAERARVDLRAALQGGVLRAGEGAALEASLAPTPEALARLLAGRLPAEATLSRPDASAPLRVTVQRLALPLAAALDARAAGADALAALLSGAEIGLEADLGAWDLVAPAGLKTSEPLRLEGVSLGARLAPEAGASRGEVELRGRLGPPHGTTLSVQARAPDILALLAALRGEGEGQLAAVASLRELPTALVETMLPSQGELREVLGDTLQVELSADTTLLAEGQGKRARGKLDLSLGIRESELTLALEGEATLPPPGSAVSVLPAFEARGEARGLEVASNLAPKGLRPLVRELLGEKLAFEARVRPASGAASLVELSLQASGAEVALAGELDPRALVVRADGPGISLSARPSAALIDSFVGPSLPKGAELSVADGPLILRVRALDLPFPTQLEQVGVEAELTLPALTYRHPAPAAGAAQLSAELSALRAEVTLAPDSGLVARVTGSVSHGAQDAIDLSLRAERPAELLAGKPASPAILEGQARGLPTALIDALAAQKGLLVDVLGPTIDLELSGRWPEEGAGLRAVLSSPSARVELDAGLEEGTLVASGEQGLQARSPLTPLYSQRIVGGLLPLLVGLAQPEGAPPVALSVTDFRLPLDGNLKKLSARIQLDLNQVSYQILPGLQGLLKGSSDGENALRVVELQPLSFAIQAGVVRYDGLPLQIGGHDLAFRGSFDLASRELDLSTEIPLSVLGSKVAAELEKVKDFIDPQTRIPLELRGNWKKPRISIGKEFLESLLKQAAEGALERGLRELLERNRKKDG